jgi:hypothetical protein
MSRTGYKHLFTQYFSQISFIYDNFLDVSELPDVKTSIV